MGRIRKSDYLISKMPRGKKAKGKSYLDESESKDTSDHQSKAITEESGYEVGENLEFTSALPPVGGGSSSSPTKEAIEPSLGGEDSTYSSTPSQISMNLGKVASKIEGISVDEEPQDEGGGLVCVNINGQKQILNADQQLASMRAKAKEKETKTSSSSIKEQKKEKSESRSRSTSISSFTSSSSSASRQKSLSPTKARISPPKEENKGDVEKKGEVFNAPSSRPHYSIGGDERWTIPRKDLPLAIYGKKSKWNAERKQRFCRGLNWKPSKEFATFICNTALGHPKSELMIFGSENTPHNMGIFWRNNETKGKPSYRYRFYDPALPLDKNIGYGAVEDRNYPPVNAGKYKDYMSLEQIYLLSLEGKDKGDDLKNPSYHRSQPDDKYTTIGGDSSGHVQVGRSVAPPRESGRDHPSHQYHHSHHHHSHSYDVDKKNRRRRHSESSEEKLRKESSPRPSERNVRSRLSTPKSHRRGDHTSPLYSERRKTHQSESSDNSSYRNKEVRKNPSSQEIKDITQAVLDALKSKPSSPMTTRTNRRGREVENLSEGTPLQHVRIISSLAYNQVNYPDYFNYYTQPPYNYYYPLNEIEDDKEDSTEEEIPPCTRIPQKRNRISQIIKNIRNY
jgi:hypothetical protein